MFQFIESIRWENGEYHLLPYHQARLKKTILDCFGKDTLIDISHKLPKPTTGDVLQKCRILYSDKIADISWQPYIRKIPNSIRIVEDNEIFYRYKYENRNKLNLLFEQRGACDDILIIKNGMVTDTFYANIVFFDGQHWFTPSSNLLPGVQRKYLIDQGIIRETEIVATDLSKYIGFKLINAMFPWASSPFHLMSVIR